MSTYKYIPASLGASARKGTTPKEDYAGLFQATLEEQFYNASNWFTISRETSIGTQEYVNIDIRMNHVINAETGLKLGNDWRTLLFKEITYTPQQGLYYYFEDNYWLTVNTESLNKSAGACTIRRCNNTLRWIEESTGVYYIEPCIIEYLVKEPRDYYTQGSPFKTPGGFLQIHTQLNDRTNLIDENQRFLFGNKNHWTGYRVVGTGLNDFRNEQTFDNESATILTVDLIADFVNYELDDLESGIASTSKNLYQIYLSSTSIQGTSGESLQLTASVIYNGNTVDRTLEWVSSNKNVAIVSNDGLVQFVSEGTCEITVGIKNNPSSASCDVTVTPVSYLNYEILVSPDVNYILENKSLTYTVYLYENNFQQSDAFAITCNSNNVPSENYIFEKLSDNSFKVTNNLRYLTSNLSVICTTGSYPAKTFDIQLKGAWL